jgi:hypothetical protein
MYPVALVQIDRPARAPTNAGKSAMRRLPTIRSYLRPLPSAGNADDSAGGLEFGDPAKAAEEVGIAALKLAKRAQAAGLPTLAYLLEIAALEAGARSTQRHGPDFP